MKILLLLLLIKIRFILLAGMVRIIRRYFGKLGVWGCRSSLAQIKVTGMLLIPKEKSTLGASI